MRIRRLLSRFLIKNSIQTKIFVVFTLVTFISLISVGAIIYFNLTKNIKHNAVNHAAESIRQADDSLVTVLSDANHIITAAITNTSNVIDILLSDNYALSYEWFLESKQVNEFLSSLIVFKSHITRISVVGMNGKIFYDGIPRLYQSNLDEELIQKIVDAEGQKVFKKMETSAGGVEGVSIGRAIRYNRHTIGVVMVDIDFQVIRNAYGIEPFESSFIYLVDEDGQLVYNTNPSIMTTRIQDTPLNDVYNELTDAEQKIERKIFGENHLIVSQSSDITGWTVIITVPGRVLIHDRIQLRNQIFQIVIFVFIAVLIVSITLATQITKNLIKLRNRMQWVKEGNFTTLHVLKSKDEIGQLNDVFNDMLVKIQELMKDIKFREEQKREAELKALQAQIRPHFIYNTLNTIIYMAQLRNALNIKEVSISLVELLRGVLSDSREFITIGEEIEYIRSYIKIQQYKLSEPIQLEVQSEDSLLLCKIPKLTMQPIVENAILHGFKSSKTKPIILVKIRKESDNVVKIELTDNGIGVDAKKMNTYLESNSAESHNATGKFSGIGILNVHERLQLIYGEDYGLKYNSQPGLYTTVEIRIPFVMKL